MFVSSRNVVMAAALLRGTLVVVAEVRGKGRDVFSMPCRFL